jgi:hypothetical protein
MKIYWRDGSLFLKTKPTKEYTFTHRWFFFNPSFGTSVMYLDFYGIHIKTYWLDLGILSIGLEVIERELN